MSSESDSSDDENSTSGPVPCLEPLITQHDSSNLTPPSGTSNQIQKTKIQNAAEESQNFPADEPIKCPIITPPPENGE